MESTNATFGMGPSLPALADPTGTTGYVTFFKTTSDASGHLGLYTATDVGTWTRVTSAIPTNVTLCATQQTWTNMPSAATEFTGSVGHTKMDLSLVQEVRLVARMAVAGQSTAVIWLEYSLDDTTGWTAFTENLPVNAIATSVGAWQTLPAGAQDDVFIRVMGSGGNGTVDPQFRNITLQLR